MGTPKPTGMSALEPQDVPALEDEHAKRRP
jgi:hypothetical protein